MRTPTHARPEPSPARDALPPPPLGSLPAPARPSALPPLPTGVSPVRLRVASGRHEQWDDVRFDRPPSPDPTHLTDSDSVTGQVGVQARAPQPYPPPGGTSIQAIVSCNNVVGSSSQRPPALTAREKIAALRHQRQAGPAAGPGTSGWARDASPERVAPAPGSPSKSRSRPQWQRPADSWYDSPHSPYNGDISMAAAARPPSPRKGSPRKTAPPTRFNGAVGTFNLAGAPPRKHHANRSSVSIPDVVGPQDYAEEVERRLHMTAQLSGDRRSAGSSVTLLGAPGIQSSSSFVASEAKGGKEVAFAPLPDGAQQDAAATRPAVPAHATEKAMAARSTVRSALLATSAGDADPDDYLHEVEKRADGNHGVSWGGVLNMGTMLLVVLGLLMLFAGYPILDKVLSKKKDWSKYGLGLGGTNGTGQVPLMGTLRGLIDTDTPSNATQWKNNAGKRFDLVFSDEFNAEGRTFYPGDDPFWEAVNIWYGATGNFEWYSPEAVNTTGGSLTLTLSQKATHNLNFQSGMLQSWNKFCFQGGYIEFNTLLPGRKPSNKGYWPAAWLMGNLGRAGYMGTTEGMWPYNYDSCDTGILKGQKFLNGSGPSGAIHSHAPFAHKGKISSLPGMRSSACTCPGEDHPGPSVNVGRGASEMDVFEMQVQEGHTHASQSLQAAPFDKQYYAGNSSDQVHIYNNSISTINSYHGGPYQESVSVVSRVPDDNFSGTGNRFVRYGMEYSPDWDGTGNGYIQWWIDGKPTWRMDGSALGPQKEMDIGQRLVPVEPMSIVLNLGISEGFQWIDWSSKDRVTFPAQMKIDYVRVYQPHGEAQRVSCDPADHPTAAYIERHVDLYYNANVTTYNKPWPRNRLTGCSSD